MFLRSVMVVFSLLLCGAACAEEAGERAVKLGGQAAQELAGTLKKELQAAIEQGGAAHAVDFCAARAMPLTVDVQEKSKLQVSRISDRNRNPANAPDVIDSRVLQFFAKELKEKGVMPGHLVVRNAEQKQYRFYKPLQIEAMCLACHGKPDQVAPEVAKIIKERYPEDKAVGYALGELRGAVKVIVADEG